MNHVRPARFVGDGRFHHLWQVGCHRRRNFARIGRDLPGLLLLKWPEWYPNSEDVKFVSQGPVLQRGSVFRWRTFGLPLESRINEFVPYSRIGWFGYAPGAVPSFYHTWYLMQQNSGCLVVTEEAGRGVGTAHLRQADESLMYRSHDLWLATLKWVSEGR
jgi:hypothetical protein